MPKRCISCSEVAKRWQGAAAQLTNLGAQHNALLLSDFWEPDLRAGQAEI